MIAPRKGLIGGHLWKIVHVPNIKGNEDDYGMCYPLQCEIHISTQRNTTKAQYLDTLMHELAHATISAYGINKLLEDPNKSFEETFICLFTPAYIITLKEFNLL